MKTQKNELNLRRTLIINALFSGLCGLIMTIAATPLGAFMGLISTGHLVMIGINLIGFSTFLVWLTRRPIMPRPLLWAVVFSDIAWVLLSGIGLILIPHQLTQMGVFLVIDVAAIVAGFAIGQMIFILRPREAMA